MPTDTVVTAQQHLDRIRGLVENGYGPEHLAAAVLIAVDPDVHGATVDALDDWDNDLEGGPVGLAEATRALIEDGVVVVDPDGFLGIEPYDDL